MLPLRMSKQGNELFKEKFQRLHRSSHPVPHHLHIHSNWHQGKLCVQCDVLKESCLLEKDPCKNPRLQNSMWSTFSQLLLIFWGVNVCALVQKKEANLCWYEQIIHCLLHEAVVLCDSW